MNGRVLANVDDQHFDGSTHGPVKKLEQGDIELVKEGPIPMVTLFRTFGLPMPSSLNSADEAQHRVALLQMYNVFKSLILKFYASQPSTTSDQKLPMPISSSPQSSNFVIPPLVALDNATKEKFLRLQSGSSLETVSIIASPSPVQPIHRPGSIMRSSPSAYTLTERKSISSSPSSEALQRQKMADAFVPGISQLPKLHNEEVVLRQGESPIYDMKMLTELVVKNLSNTDPTQLEGQKLQAFARALVNACSSLTPRRTPHLIDQVISIVKMQEITGKCRLSLDKTRFSIIVPSTINQSILPKIDEATLDDIYSQMSGQIGNIAKFDSCVNAVMNSYNKWKNISPEERKQRATAAVIAFVEGRRV